MPPSWLTSVTSTRPRTLHPFHLPGALVAVVAVVAVGSGAGAMASDRGSPPSRATLTSHLEAKAPGSEGWARPVRVRGFSHGESVSCASPTFCLAVAFPDPELRGSAVTFDGRRWSRARTLPFGTDADVSCPGPADCVIADGTGDMFTYLRGRWSRPDYVDQLGDISSVSCTSTAYCLTADDSGDDLSYVNRHWSAPRHGPIADPYTVSCASITFCLAVGDDGFSYVIDDGKWSLAGQADGTAYPTGLSCVKPSFCMIVDALGNVAEFNGAWSPSMAIGDNDELTALSCTSPTSCVAGDYQGRILTYTNGQWSPPKKVFTSGGVTSLSCIGPRFCVAVGPTQADVFRSPG